MVKEKNKKITPTQEKKSKKKSPTAKKTVVKKSKGNKKNGYIPELKKYYKDVIIGNLTKKFNYSTVMECPRVVKIILNMGVGDAKVNAKSLKSSVNELTVISGQKPIITKAKTDISNFKIRRGFPVGIKVTLRANRMYEFLERLNSIALPRSRDFTGLSFKSFDGRGNYNFGIKEQIVFTEIDYDDIEAIRGLDIAINTTASTDEECYWLLKEFGLPLRERPVKDQAEKESA
jgi:large subunit ribosomal protein L5|tara:strand:- start:1596 stop:2291 length:696 start_codon:yes stop_codon:yes gene_type:complete